MTPEERWETLKKHLLEFKETRLVQDHISAKTAVQIILNEMKQLEEK